MVLLQLSRNFGMEVAMSAGIDHARGDYVVLIHADLQDPPELIRQMLERARDARTPTWSTPAGSDATRAASSAAFATDLLPR